MDRLSSMSRFDTNIPEEVVVGYCDRCQEELLSGQDVVKFEHEVFCDIECIKQYYDIKVEPIFVD